MAGLGVMRRAGVADLQMGEGDEGSGWAGSWQDLGTGWAVTASFAEFRKQIEVYAFLCPHAFLWRGVADC